MNILKSIVKKTISADIVQLIVKKIIREDQWLFLTWYRNNFGFLAAIRGYLYLLLNNGIGLVPNILYRGDVFLRPGTIDQDVYNNVFISKEHDIDFINPRIIINAGAHIGLVSVFFANKYPAATIIAIEPEPSNFKMLLMNTASYTNIKPIQAGLWNRKTHLFIQDSDVKSWGFRVSESPSGIGIPALGVEDIMSDFGVKEIDVLKIDIEGSELEVLNHHNSWIDAVKNLIIELHDRFRPGCSEALDKALIGHYYDRSKRGENIVIANIRRAPT